MVGGQWFRNDWQVMTMAKLCSNVWLIRVDGACLHARGRAHGVYVLICQAHADEALVGEDMVENAGGGTDLPIIVPIVLNH